MTRTLIVILALLMLLGCSKDNIKYYQCTHEDGGIVDYLYAYDKEYFYTVEKDTFKERERIKIERIKDDILYAPVFYEDKKNKSLIKEIEYRFNKSNEKLHKHFYSAVKSNNPAIRDDYYLKCQEVRPAK